MNSYDQNDYEITESLIFYLNNTASVEIMTKHGLMKIYFPIPKACVHISKVLSQRIIEEMTEASPQESIKYICYKALIIKERLGVEKEKNKIKEFSRVLVNNITKLSNISFLLLFIYLILEVWKNISEPNFIDLAKGVVGVILFAIALLIFFSYFIDSYNKIKAELSSSGIFTHKKKKTEGSLGYNAFPKEINNTQITFDNKVKPKMRKVVLKAAIDFRNIVNFIMILLIFISLVSYNQIFRAILLVKIASIDVKRVLKSRLYYNYPIIFRSGLIIVLLVLVAYVLSLTEDTHET